MCGSWNTQPAYEGSKPRIGANRIPGLVYLQERQSHVAAFGGRQLQPGERPLSIADLSAQTRNIE